MPEHRPSLTSDAHTVRRSATLGTAITLYLQQITMRKLCCIAFNSAIDSIQHNSLSVIRPWSRVMSGCARASLTSDAHTVRRSATLGTAITLYLQQITLRKLCCVAFTSAIDSIKHNSLSEICPWSRVMAINAVAADSQSSRQSHRSMLTRNNV